MPKKNKVKNVPTILRAMKKSHIMYNFFQTDTFCKRKQIADVINMLTKNH